MRTRDRRGVRPKPEWVMSRVQKVEDRDLPLYLDTAVMGLGQALDAWRFHNAPGKEVERAIDAISALWSEIERRGLTKS